MAFNGRRAVPARQWFRLTEDPVTNVSFQVASGGAVFLAATASTTAPAEAPTAGSGPSYGPGYGQVNFSVPGAFLGVAGAAHLWAFSADSAVMWVSHA